MGAKSAVTEAELTSAVELLQQLIPKDEQTIYALDASPATVYTHLVTLWMLTLQRLDEGSSLAAVVQNVQQQHRSLLPDNKRVREGTLSLQSGSFSQARKRLPLDLAERFAEQVSQSLIAQTPGWREGRRGYVLDGTTITLAPTSNLRDAFPPATNQHGETVWPVLMLMVAHELQSGCALIPELGAMYGPHNTSEAQQAAAIAGRIPAGSLVLADAGFGIFSVAHALCDARQDILLRLTTARFKALRRRAEELERTADGVRYRLRWTPSNKERKTNPDLPTDAVLEVFLHEIKLPTGEVLYLVTTLAVGSGEAAEYYSHRYDVEHDIRDVKVSLGIETIRAKSAEMVRKELLCSIVAYNLVVHLRREAAKVAGLDPRQLSFTGVWTTMRFRLLHRDPCSWPEWQARYAEALRLAATQKLPNRPGRSYPRRAHPRGAKSTKFMRQKKNPDRTNDPDTPK